MYRVIILTIFLLFRSVPPAYTQSPGRYLLQYRQAERLYNLANATDRTDSAALALYEKLISGLSKNHINDSILFDCYYKSGILLQTKNRHDQAISSFRAAIKLRDISSLPDSLLFKPDIYLGTSYYILNDFDSASYYFKSAEKMSIKYPRISDLERLYNKIGTMYYETGNYLQSKNYFEKALSTLDSSNSFNLFLLVNYKNNIASALRKLQQYPQALSIYKSLLSFNIEKNGLLHNIGDTYLGMGDFESAIHYLQETSYSNEKKFNDIGYAFLQLRKYDSATIYLDKALNLGSQPHKSIAKGITLTYRGQLNLLKGRMEDALNNFQQAIIQLDPDFYGESITDNPIAFEGVHSFFNLFDALVGKARAFRQFYERTQNGSQLNASVNTLSAAFNLSNRIEETYESDEARLFLNQKVQPAYQEFVESSLKLFELTKDVNWLRQAIGTAESSKAAVLRSNVQQLSLINIRGIPRELIVKEKNLKSLVVKYRLLLSQSADTVQALSLQQFIRDTEINLARVHEQLNAQPAYAALWDRFSQTDISSIQRKFLSAEEAILSYYFTGASLCIFVITRDSLSYKKINVGVRLLHQIDSIKQLITSDEPDRDRLSAIQQALYLQLITPILPLIRLKSKLIVIPHNELLYIPFEILGNTNDELMVSDFSIRYEYSINFLQRPTRSLNENRIIAFAPFSSPGPAGKILPTLPSSRQEINSIKGELFIDSAATKKKFIQMSSEFSVAHLATHAFANDSVPLRSFIAFYPYNSADSDYKLFEPEIYNLDLHAARLVVLSACETGKGKLIQGEGMLSMSRAFSYAGCQSIITSLWKADDQATAYIARRLHFYLSRGSDKDIALQKAKIDYLKDNEIEQRFKLPLYWANLVLVGDPSPVGQKTNSSLVYLFGVVIFLAAGIIWLLKRHFNKIKNA